LSNSNSRKEVIPNFLLENAPEDLAARYVHGMELQVMARQGDGEPYIDASAKPRWGWYSDGNDTWYSFRIQDQESAGKSVTFSLDRHYDAIGDPCNGLSYGVGFDFDSLVSHTVGLTDDQLEAIREKLASLEYVELRYSTSGNGYHAWVWFDPDNLPKTENRAEHKALARAVLKKMSLDTGYEFSDEVDHLGELLWICARRATDENGGLTLIKAAAEPLTDYPADWRDHLEVVQSSRRRTRLRGPNDKLESDSIESAFQDRPTAPLDDQHKKFIDAYGRTDFEGFWQADHGCFVAHTYGIKLAMKEASIVGIFETVSEGSDPSTPNCFMFPLENGVWQVYRFSQGFEEHKSWDTSPSGWTTAILNRMPTGEQTALAFGGKRSPRKKCDVYIYQNSANAKKAMEAHGLDVSFPKWLRHERPVTLEYGDEHGIIVQFPYSRKDDDQYLHKMAKDGWTKERGPVWAKLFDIDLAKHQLDLSATADALVRHVSQDGKQIGLFAKTEADWQEMHGSQIKAFLNYKGVKNPMTTEVLGFCADNPWMLDAIPFENQYPGKRVWNRDGAQLLFQPSDRPGQTPHWNLIFNHIGRGLDVAVAEDEWCRNHDIESGADYLRAWAAILIRNPKRRLPLLFLYSPEQNTGKSILYESLKELFEDSAFTRGDNALKNNSGFNGELHGSALCIVEETDLRKAGEAYTRIKGWLTSDTIHISHKGADGFDTVNYTHWIMTANNSKNLPIEPGDTRVVMWEVPPFEGEEIPREELLPLLRKEAPNFLQQLFALDLTDAEGRHTLPILMTDEKNKALEEAKIAAESFGLGETADKAIAAILNMEKPWKGTCADLCSALGDWDGFAKEKSKRARNTSLGLQMKRIQPTLKGKGTTLEINTHKKTSQYAISA